MRKKITILSAALMLLAFLAVPLGMRGQTRTEVTDVLNRELTGVSGTTYTSWSGKTSNSEAVYAGQSAGGNESIQLRSSNNNSGIITTTSGGTVTHISVSWNTNTQSGRTLNVYGKSAAYTSPTELYNNQTQGTLIGTIVCGTNTELTINDEYEYIGLRSSNGAMWLSEINITWDNGSTSTNPSISAENVNIAYDATSGTIAYTINNGVDGGTLTAATESEWLTLPNSFASPIQFTCSANGTAAERTATVTLTYAYGDSQTVTKNVNVTQAGNPNVVDNISDITEVGANYHVKGTVVATNSRGFIIGDGTGYVYTYLNAAPTQQVGDNLSISGTTGSYGHIIQFTNSATIETVDQTNYNGEPGFTVLTEVPDYSQGYHTSDYFQFEGLLTSQASTNYTNYYIALGANSICISYPTTNQQTELTALLNKTVRVHGFFAGISSSTGFTVMMESVEEVVSTDPSINAGNVEISCETTIGSITYSISNVPTPVGTLTAAVTEGNWLTLGESTDNPIPFTCTVNEAATERTATVTLTYTYGDNQTVTKDVTVTQLGNPNVVNNISDITEVGVNYHVKGMVVATSAKGFIICDGTGLVYTYLNAAPTQQMGDFVQITGTTGSYGHVIQFTSDATISEAEEFTFDWPEYTVIIEVPNYTEGYHLSDYFQFEGNLTKSGNNYLVAVGEGQIRISYPTTVQAEDLTALLDKTVRIHGFFTGYSGSGNNAVFTAMMESYEEVASTEPSIAVEPATVNVNAEEHDGTLDLTYENLTISGMDDFDIQYYDAEGEEAAEPDWIAVEIAEQDPQIGEGYVVSYLIDANEGEARTAYFKVYAMNGEELVYSNLVTVTQAAYVAPYANLPFAFDGGRAAIETTAGLTQVNLGSDYNNSPKLKFDKGNKDDDGLYSTLVLRINERPDTLTYNIKGNNFSGGTFKVQTSVDGVTYTDLKTYTELTTTVQSEEFTNLGENVRYIKWIYTQKDNGNVALGNIKLSKYSEPAPVLSITVDPTSIDVPAEGGSGTIAVTYNNFNLDELELEVHFFAEDGETTAEYDWITAVFNSEHNVEYSIGANTGEARNAYFKVSEVSEGYDSELITVSQAEYVAPAGWVLTDLAGITENDVFVIVGTDVSGGTYAMSNDNGTSSAPAAVAVTVVDEVLQGPAANIQWNLSITDDGYIFYPNGDTEKWLYCTNTNNGVRVGTGDAKHFTQSGGYLTTTETADQRYIGIYNAQDWRCYKDTNGNIADQTFAFYKQSGTPTPPQPQPGTITVAPETMDLTAEQHFIANESAFTVTYENIVDSTYQCFTIHYYNVEGEEIQLGETPWHVLGVTGTNDEGYQVTGYVTANEGDARTAYFKVSAQDANGNTVYSNLVTINQDAYVAPVVPESWVLTDFADLMEGDVFVIVGNNGATYAMSNDNGANNPPAAVGVLVVDDALSEAPAANLQWNLSLTENGYVFYPNGETETWLYCTNNNNGVRVGGTNYNNVFVMDQSGYLKHVSTGRYIGIYNSQDWRCYTYTTTNSNIANQTFSFYKKVVEPETYTLDITGYGNNEGGYYLIASPVYVNPETTGMTQGDFDLYRFDQSQADEWRNYETNHFNLVPGKGYLYAHKTDTILNFTGTPYSGNGQITLKKTADAQFEGWNLIGNPFGNAATIDKAYYRLNADGSEVNAETESSEVAVMEGVFVVAETETNGETVTFTEQTNPVNNDQVSLFSINVSMNYGATIDRAIVRFDNGNQLPKFQLNPNHTKVYIPQGENDYAIVRSANEGEMPVNFKAAKNGTYTISVNADNVEMEYLHLIDNMTGADVDLLAMPSYSFEARTTDYANRFRLVFSANDENGAATDSETFAFFNGSEWCISNMGAATLQVIDVTGRILSSENVNGNATISLNETPGVYVFRLVNGDNVKTQKIVVK